jgi:hypothetical protein
MLFCQLGRAHSLGRSSVGSPVWGADSTISECGGLLRARLFPTPTPTVPMPCSRAFSCSCSPVAKRLPLRSHFDSSISSTALMPPSSTYAWRCLTGRSEISSPKGNILADEMINLPGSGKNACEFRLLRRVVVWDPVGMRLIVLDRWVAAQVPSFSQTAIRKRE